MNPNAVVLNRDDLNYSSFQDFQGTQKTLDFGTTGKDVRILNSKLYAKGTEATFSIHSNVETFASFVPGETTVSYMACAAAIALSMDIDIEKIIDGIANYEI